MIDLSRLNRRLISYRQAKGVSQYQVSKATHIGRSCISQHEAGLSLPSLLNLIAYADYYGVTVSDLLGETDGEKETN